MKKVPELRFKEFNEEWKEEKLGDIGHFYKGKNISKEDLSNKGIECIRYGELYTTYKEKIDLVFNKTRLQLEKLFLSQKNDILIPSSGETAIDISTSSCILKENVALGGDITIIRTKNDGIFLAYYLNYLKKRDIAKLAQGISIIHLYINHLKSLNLKLPSRKEQQKIASFLSAIDKKIELTDKKLEFLEKYKKGLMQKLLTGKVRFSGFSVGWKEEKLKNIAKIYQPQTISKSKLNDNYNYLVYGANGIIGKYNKYNHEKEQILVSCRGANCGIVNFSCPFCWITGNTMVINTDDNRNIDKNFLYFYLKNDKLNYLITGSGQPQITSNIGLHKINLPSLPEQQKIASFLSAIDKKIELIKSRLENLKGYKKGLLQKMFV